MTAVQNSYPNQGVSNSNIPMPDTSEWTPAQVAAFFKMLEQTAAGVGAATAGKETTAQSMADMAYALQMLQLVIGESANKKTQNDELISQAQVGAAQAQLKKIQDQIAEMQREQEKADKIGFWSSFAEIFTTIVVDIVAVVTCQPELAVISTAMLAMSMSGGFDKLTTAIASLLEDMHIPSSVANILAAVAVVIIVIALTARAAPNATLESAAGQTANGVQRTAVVAADETAEAAGQQASLFSKFMDRLSTIATKFKAGFDKINLFNRLSLRTNLMILNGLQATVETKLPTYFADGIASAKGMSDEEKQKLEMIMNIIAEVTALIDAIGGGVAIGDQMGKIASGTSKISAFLEKIKAVVSGSLFMRLSSAMIQVGRLATCGTGVALGVNEIQQGQKEAILAELKAGYTLLETAMQMSTEETKEDTSAFAKQEAAHAQSTQSIADLVKGYGAFSELLTS